MNKVWKKYAVFLATVAVVSLSYAGLIFWQIYTSRPVQLLLNEADLYWQSPHAVVEAGEVYEF